MTPRQRRRQRTRQEILDTARSLLIEKGPSQLSLRAVARACDYSPAALYEYFGNKGELLGEVLDRGFEELQDALRGVPEELESRTRLTRLGLAYIEFAQRRPDLFQLLFTMTPSSLTSLEAVRSGDNHFAILRAAMLDHLAKAGLETGDELATEAAVYGFWSLVHGMAMLQSTFLREFEAPFEVADRRAIDCYLAGLER